MPNRQTNINVFLIKFENQNMTVEVCIIDNTFHSAKLCHDGNIECCL